MDRGNNSDNSLHGNDNRASKHGSTAYYDRRSITPLPSTPSDAPSGKRHSSVPPISEDQQSTSTFQGSPAGPAHLSYGRQLSTPAFQGSPAPPSRLPSGHQPSTLASQRSESGTQQSITEVHQLRFPINTAWKPDCQIPIARVTYELNEPPSELLFLQVEVLSKDTFSSETDDQGWKKVSSGKLRTAALKEFVSTFYSHVGNRYAIDINARTHQLDDLLTDTEEKRELTNHIIFPVLNGQTKKIEKISKNLTDEPQLLQDTIRPKSEGEPEGIWCILSYKKLVTRFAPGNLYRNGLELLFRRYACKQLIKSPEDTPLYELPKARPDAEYFDMLPDTLPNTIASEDGILTLRKCGFDIRLRHRPDIELSEDKVKLHLDFDLFPIKSHKMTAAEVVNNLFNDQFDTSKGGKVTAETIDGLLRGLRASYERDVTSKSGQKEPLGESSGNSAKRPESSQSTTDKQKKSKTKKLKCVIKKITEVGEENVAPGNISVAFAGTFKASVEETRNKQLQSISLDSLTIYFDDLLRKTSNLTHNLRQFASVFNTEEMRNYITEIAEQTMDRAQKATSKGSISDFSHGPSQISLYSKPTEDIMSPKPDRENPSTAVTTVVYITEQGQESNGTFLSKVKKALQEATSPIHFGEITTTTITSVQDLKRQEADANSDFMKAFHPKTDNQLIIGIINSSSRSDKLALKTELRRFGEQRIGAVVAFFGREKLEARSNRKKEGLVFRNRDMKKISFMLNSRHYVVPEVPVMDLSDCLILGSHISHYKPPFSLASVVRASGTKPFHYEGRVGLLPRPTKKCPDEITGFEGLLQDYFEAWKNKKSNKTIPKIIFYRGGCNIDDEDVCSREMNAIREVMQKVFEIDSSDVLSKKVTYIGVTKNLRRDFAEPKEPNGTNFTPYTFTTNRAVNIPATYQYHVLENGPGYRALELRNLTAYLNKLSLFKNSTKVALPVHYAEQLGKHVLNTFPGYLSQESNENSNDQPWDNSLKKKMFWL